MNSALKLIPGKIINTLSNSRQGFHLEISADMGFGVGDTVWICREPAQPLEAVDVTDAMLQDACAAYWHGRTVATSGTRDDCAAMRAALTAALAHPRPTDASNATADEGPNDPDGLRRGIYEFLAAYRLQNWTDEDGDSGYPLVDALSNGAGTIAPGLGELEYLADSLAAHLSESGIAALTGEQAGEVVARFPRRLATADRENATLNAWNVLRPMLAPEHWSTGESATFYGFFCWGWEAATQYHADDIDQPRPMGVPDGWRSMETAPKDGTPVLLIGAPKAPERVDWLASRQFVGRHTSDSTEWSFAAPVGMGGIATSWLAGWMPLPAAPAPGKGGEA